MNEEKNQHKHVEPKKSLAQRIVTAPLKAVDYATRPSEEFKRRKELARLKA